jgi:hypothetical protein
MGVAPFAAKHDPCGLPRPEVCTSSVNSSGRTPSRAVRCSVFIHRSAVGPASCPMLCPVKKTDDGCLSGPALWSRYGMSRYSAGRLSTLPDGPPGGRAGSERAATLQSVIRSTNPTTFAIVDGESNPVVDGFGPAAPHCYAVSKTLSSMLALSFHAFYIW